MGGQEGFHLRIFTSAAEGGNPRHSGINSSSHFVGEVGCFF
jgi:hypothetical protein